MPLRRRALDLRRHAGLRHRLQLHGLPTLRHALAYDYEGERIKISGETKAYVRGKALSFNFCPECGCVAYWRGLALNDKGQRRIAVNLRLADDPKAVAAIVIDHFDGLDSFDDLPRDGRCVSDMWF